MARFRDIHVEKTERFSIGYDEETGRYYLSIPVTNGLVDYEEYYYIEDALASGFPANFNQMLVLVMKCRNRENDDNLILKPGINRGTAY